MHEVILDGCANVDYFLQYYLLVVFPAPFNDKMNL